MTNFQRQHPLYVVHAFSKYLLLLIFPLLRSLLLLRGDVWAWVRGTWFDLLIVVLIILFGVVQWRSIRYSLGEKGVYVESGFLVQEIRYLPYKNLSSIAVEEPFYLRPLRIARVRLETDGGSLSRADAALLLRRSQVEEVLEAALTVLFASTFISQSGKILGETFERLLVDSIARIIRVLAFNIPPAAAIIAAVLLGGWAIAFLMTLISHLGFHATRENRLLSVRVGILTKKEAYMAVERINYVQLRQSLLTKLCGFCSAFLNCTGYGKEKNELAVLFPAVEQQDLRRTLRLILPEIKVSPRRYKPYIKVLTRFLIPPVTLIFAAAAVFGLAWFLFPNFRQVSLFLGIMAELPSIWWLLSRLPPIFMWASASGGIFIPSDLLLATPFTPWPSTRTKSRRWKPSSPSSRKCQNAPIF